MKFKNKQPHKMYISKEKQKTNLKSTFSLPLLFDRQTVAEKKGFEIFAVFSAKKKIYRKPIHISYP